MTEVVYSHRAAAGVSVAAVNKNSRLLIAISLVNDGTSRNGIMWKERRDTFSRPKARLVLLNRLEAANTSPDNTVHMTLVFNTDLTGRRFISQFRKIFKPVADESDITFCDIFHDATNMETRYRKPAKIILQDTIKMVHNVMSNQTTLQQAR